jgi:putative peptide zinc metalloprotease protein
VPTPGQRPATARTDAGPPPPPPEPPSDGGEGAPQADRPRLAEGVELMGEYEGSGFKEPRYLARRSDGQMIQLTYLLHLVAEQADGGKDFKQMAAGVSEKFGRRVSADNVEFLVDKSLRPSGVLTQADGASPKLKKIDPLLRLKFKTVLLPEGAVNFLAVLLKPLFWPPVMIAMLAGLVALDVWYFGVHGIGQSIRDLIYQPIVILAIYGLLIVSIAWHELGHAAACRYGGARPGVIGFGIYVVWPAFYNDVTDTYRLGKGGRVRTDLGGVYFNVIYSLGIAGVYFLTGWEPLLVLVLVQHVLVLYQFIPFLRLDGYYVVSDLTGVPDLFARIKPTLASLVPWKKSRKEVRELKPWVRVVVTAWVLAVVPVLLYCFAMMVISAPRLLATAYDSMFVQWDKVSGALDGGKWAAAAAGGLQMGMLVLPTTGMSVTISRVAKRLVSGALRVTKGRPIARTLVALVGAGAVGFAAFVLYPNGEYRPIQPNEKWTLGSSFEALGDVASGRPSLTPEQEEELGGAPTVHEQSGADVGSDAPDEAPEEGGENPPTTDEEADEPGDTGDTPEPTPSPDSSPAETPEG